MSSPIINPDQYPGLTAVYDSAYVTRYTRQFQGTFDSLLSVFNDEREELDAYRHEFDELFIHGLKTGLLNDKARADLRSFDSEHRLAMISELEAGKFFSDRHVQWNPRPVGREGRYGDLLLVNGNGNVFVEVKTLVDRPDQIAENVVNSKLWKATKDCLDKGNYSVLVRTHIVKLASDFNGAHYRRWLEKLLRSAQSLPCKEEYQAVSGLSLTVKIQPSPLTSGNSAQFQMSKAKWISNERYLKHSLAKAYRQVPEDRPSLVILRSHLSAPVDNEDVLNALYGDETWLVDPLRDSAAVESRRAHNGFFRPTKHQRVSAVALLVSTRRLVGSSGKLSVYHNPFSRMPLNVNDFQLEGIRQFAPHSDGVMRWLDA